MWLVNLNIMFLLCEPDAQNLPCNWLENISTLSTVSFPLTYLLAFHPFLLQPHSPHLLSWYHCLHILSFWKQAKFSVFTCDIKPAILRKRKHTSLFYAAKITANHHLILLSLSYLNHPQFNFCLLFASQRCGLFFFFDFPNPAWSFPPRLPFLHNGLRLH